MTGSARRSTYKGQPVDHVIHVRSKLEFWLGHLDGAVCMPVDVVADRVRSTPTIGPDARLLLYCASGARSAAAAGQLRAMGFRHVTDAGGIGEASRHFEAGH